MPGSAKRPTAVGRDHARLQTAGRRMAKTALAAGEMATAAGQVIGYRTAMMAEAMGDPAAMIDPEFTLMGHEKVDAILESAVAMADGTRALFDAWTVWMTGQSRAALGAVSGLATCRTPFDLLEVQYRFIEASLSGTMASGSRIALGAARLAQAGLAPVHRTATANALRLARERR